MNKKALSESDICDRYITPALGKAGWTGSLRRREFSFTDGRIVVRGKLVARGKGKRADYLLFYKPNLPIAVVEAKDNNHSVGAGIQQALDYAISLDVPFVFSSNGDGFVFHDRTGTFDTIEQNLSLDEFPSPETLWSHYKTWKGLDSVDQDLVTSPNHSDLTGKMPRYYQQLAINRTIEAVAKGQRRLLLTMATGTGKTYTAFNIIWRLWKNGDAKRVLFLADRNILVDQTKINDFAPFGDAMVKLDRSLVDKPSGHVDTSYEIYLSLYQAIIGGKDAESGESNEPIYDKFPKDFFDLIVIDECHRGSADADSAWHVILDYFDSAIQLGMTATPKETKYVSNIDYFGEPVYSYSLKQGIDDGFLAPFKVVRVDFDHDALGWRPKKGEVDDFGNVITDQIFNQKDFDKTIVFPDRDRATADWISTFLHETDPMNKTIVFCQNIDHAERMRQALVNDPLNSELVLQDDRYVMRITGDSPEGKAQLDNFINPKRAFPVIATTSKLMSTGVDAQTCHVIALDQRIQSLAEFKQIIGRGTRLRTDYGKFFFTILDFRKATELFADPDWDGPPLQDEDFGDAKPEIVKNPDLTVTMTVDGKEYIVLDPGDVIDEAAGDDDAAAIVFRVSGTEFKVLAERVQYYDKDGKLITESLKDYTRKTVQGEFATLDDFLKKWNESDRKQVILDELLEQGILLEALAESAGNDLSPFDLICHIAFDQPPLTRQERVSNVKKRDVFTKYGDQARAVLDALLDKYADQGLEDLGEIEILQLEPFTEIGTPIEIVKAFGGRQGYLEAVHDLSTEIYKTA
jgi:type I restriction enzyme R subunit